MFGTPMPHQPGYSGWRDAALVLCTNFAFMAALSVLNLVIPDIAADFGVTEAQASWAVLLPYIIAAAFNPAAGKFADLFGRKEVWIAGTVLNIASLVLAGRAQTVAELLTARALCGLGTALEQPSGSALMQAAFPPEQQSIIIAWSTMNNTVAPMLGMLLGGWLAELYGWRILFLGPILPVTVACAIAARTLPPSKTASQTLTECFKDFDVKGTVALGVTTTSLLLTITEESDRSGRWLLVFFAATLVLWHVERVAAKPIIPNSMFASSEIIIAHSWRFIYFTIHVGNIMMVSLYLRDVGKMGPSDSAFWSVSRPMVSAAAMVCTGRLLQRCKARGYSYSMVVCAAAVVGVVDKTMSVTFGWNGGADKTALVTMLALQGAVAAVSSVTLRVLILELVSEDERGNTNGVLNTAVSVAQSLGSALGVGLPALEPLDAVGAREATPRSEAERTVRAYRVGSSILLLAYLSFLFLPVALGAKRSPRTSQGLGLPRTRKGVMTVGGAGLALVLLFSGSILEYAADAPVNYAGTFTTTTDAPPDALGANVLSEDTQRRHSGLITTGPGHARQVTSDAADTRGPAPQCTFFRPPKGDDYSRAQGSYAYEGKHCTQGDEAEITRLMALLPRGWDEGEVVPYELENNKTGGRPSAALQCHAMTKLMHSEIQDKHNVKKLIATWEPDLNFPSDFGTFRSAEDITEEFVRSLPGPAIFKATHTCGGVIKVDLGTAFCLKRPCTGDHAGEDAEAEGQSPETTDGNIREITAFLRANCAAWLNYNYEDVFGEMSYKHIPRGCMFEQLLYRTDVAEGIEFSAPTHDPNQLNIFVYHGRIMFISVASYSKDRKRTHFKYTADLKLLPGGYWTDGGTSHHVNMDICTGRHKDCGFGNLLDPDVRERVFAQAIRLAARAGAPEVRVDFMLQSRREVSFSELTYTTGACFTWFTPRVLDMLLGEISANSSSTISSECFGEIAAAVSCSHSNPYRGMAACDWEFLRQCNDSKTDESFVPSADERCDTAEAIELNPWECDVLKGSATKRVSSPSFQQLIDVAGVKGLQRECKVVELELLFQYEREVLLRAFALRDR